MFHFIKKGLLVLLITSSISVSAQHEKISLKDTLDNKLDVSDWVLKAKGFIPIGNIITEPALGGFGVSAFAVWITPNTPYIDTVNNQVVKTRVKPNLYAAGGAYTINNSWMVFGAAAGAIKKWRSNYRLVSGLVDLNLRFYRDLPSIGEQSYEFNIRMVPVMGQLIKQFGRSNWFAGLNYTFLKTELLRTNVEFHTPNDVTAFVSKPGILLEYDSRDNYFTPDKGYRWNTLLSSSASWLGSDYSFGNVSSALFWYVPVSTKVISAYRMEYQYLWGDAPFYLLPYINMRGIPAARYQGNTIVVGETEWRWDFTSRYSLIGFAGAGKAVTRNKSWEEVSWQPSAGGGFRYLIARQLKLRAGMDIARGPEQWAYYITFGTSWIR